MNSSYSRRFIELFIQQHAIAMNDFVVPVGGYISFNEFFIRKLLPTARQIDGDTRHVVAPADSSVMVFSVLEQQTSFVIKQARCTLEQLFADHTLARGYEGGSVMIFRLVPHDYHRVHFPLQGVALRARAVHGNYESVHPRVYEAGVQPLLGNERQIVLFDTALCDQVAMVLVGALCVGTVVTTYNPSVLCEKGDELGYFAFGGSTVVMVCKAGTIEIDPLLRQNSAHGLETVVKMGQKIATVR